MVVTDYPDADLIENLVYNVSRNLEVEERKRVDVQVCYLKSFYLFSLYLRYFDRDISGGSPSTPY